MSSSQRTCATISPHEPRPRLQQVGMDFVHIDEIHTHLPRTRGRGAGEPNFSGWMPGGSRAGLARRRPENGRTTPPQRVVHRALLRVAGEPNFSGRIPGASSRSLARRQAGNDRDSTRVRELSFPTADEASGRLVVPGAARASCRNRFDPRRTAQPPHWRGRGGVPGRASRLPFPGRAPRSVRLRALLRHGNRRPA